MKAGDEVPAGKMYITCQSCLGTGERICDMCGIYHECGCCKGSGKSRNLEYETMIVPGDAELQRREGK